MDPNEKDSLTGSIGDTVGAKERSERFADEFNRLHKDPSNAWLMRMQKRSDVGKVSERTAMGEYVPPNRDGKTLTSLGYCVPGPADYLPRMGLTKETAPQYSMLGRHKPLDDHNYSTGPGDRDISHDAVWTGRTITLKGKAQKGFSHIDDTITLGPQSYYITDSNAIGNGGCKATLKSRHPHSVQSGLSNPAPNAHRVNTNLFKSAPKPSFGVKTQVSKLDSPGPAAYTVPKRDRGHACSMAPLLKTANSIQLSLNANIPGPGTYDVPTLMGDAVANTLGGRPGNEVDAKAWVPSPNTYTLQSTINRNAAVMTYRPFEVKHTDVKPGPNHYNVIYNKSSALPPTIGVRSKPGYPMSLQFPTIAMINEPGPGSYILPQEKVTRKFSMGARLKQSPRNDIPGPGHYSFVPCRPDAKRSPAYSMKGRMSTATQFSSPGPAAYYPSQPKNSVSHSMTTRPKNVSDSEGIPAPNMYSLKYGMTSKGPPTANGPALKSRHSPWVYTGLRQTTG